MKIIVAHDNGTTQDITSLVQVAFDVATHSMDWGSGFLDVEETDGLILLAAACGFPALEEILQDQWRDRQAEAVNHHYAELDRIARERGVPSPHHVDFKPSPEEMIQFLDDLKRRYTPSSVTDPE